MDVSPLSRQFGSRLEKLNQEIHEGLQKVRKHLQELEEVEQSARSDKAGQTFSELLKSFTARQKPPASDS